MPFTYVVYVCMYVATFCSTKGFLSIRGEGTKNKLMCHKIKLSYDKRHFICILRTHALEEYIIFFSKLKVHYKYLKSGT